MKRNYNREVMGEQVETQRCSRESNSDDHGIACIVLPCRPFRSSFFPFFYFSAATQTLRTRTDHPPRSRDRIYLKTAEDPQRPQFLAVDPCRFPRKTGTSGSPYSGLVSRTATLTRHFNDTK